MDEKPDIYAKAFAELTGIDSQIAALEQRRAALRQFIDLGQKLFADIDQSARNAKVQTKGSMGTRFGTPVAFTTTREQSMKGRILALSKQAIQERGPQHTAALIEFIEAAGVVITGAHKPTTVSVILSRSNEFLSDRKVGWTLTEGRSEPFQKELTPQDVAASAGSSTA